MTEETWSWRERPLLEIALREVDAHGQVDFADLAAETGLDPLVIWRTMKVLEGRRLRRRLPRVDALRLHSQA